MPSQVLPLPPFASPKAPLPLGRASSDLRATERRWLIAAVAGVHLLGLWGLLQVRVVRDAVREVSPLTVDFIQLEAPPQPIPPRPISPRPPSAQRPLTPAPRSLPLLAAAPTASPEPAAFVAPVPAPEPATASAVVAAPAPPAQPAPPPLAPAAPKLLPATAVRYLVPPAIEVPLASRRLGEAGTVLLRVVVDTAGLPRQVSVHQSAGFARLDEQALRAMRQARFKPQTENGQPIEWIVIAPLQYEIE